LIRHQLLILNRGRKRAPNLRVSDRIIPHSSLGPRTPDPRSPKAELQAQRHCSERLPSCSDFNPGRCPSRVPVRENCRMKERIQNARIYFLRTTPDPSSPKADLQAQRHCIAKDSRVGATSILGGLHHEYRLENVAA
jgi:hypothetical protein